MPPPELFDRAAPASVGALMLEHLRAEVPMPRHNGPRAAEAYLRARLAEFRAVADTDAERELSIQLARMLAARGRDLGLATRLARQALLIEDDPMLRVELAGWLAGLGDTVEAAEVLRSLVRPDRPAESARTIVKMAVLLARAGNAGAAAAALDEAASLDPADAMGVELFGTLSAWAPETVPPEGAAAAYLEAARRRATGGDEEAAYEDRIRAFDTAPHDLAAAEAMAEALVARGQPAAADEVLRIHAAARAARDEPVLPIHRRRMLTALADGDAGRAAGAILDAGLEGEIEGDDAAQVDEALALAGLTDIHAARLHARTEGLSDDDFDAYLREIAGAVEGRDGDPRRVSAALVLATRAGLVPERAAAVEQLAGAARHHALRAVLLAVAADLHARAAPSAGAEGMERARRAASHACEADPACARALATLASIPGPDADRIAAAAVERAMALVLPRGVWCERLSRVFEALGEPAVAFTWTQRWVALCPGSAAAMEQLLRRSIAAGTEPPGAREQSAAAAAPADPGARIAEALGWVLAQARPLAALAEPIAAALEALVESGRPRARALARKTLDVLGPRVPSLRERLVELSAEAGDQGLAVAVLERYLAAGGLPEGAEGRVLLDLARRRAAASDQDGAAHELARAAEAGADPESVLSHLGDLEAGMREVGAALGSDGLIAAAEAKATALAALGPSSAGAAAVALRELGSLLWDLGEDHERGEDAFFRACAITPDGGVARYARDMAAFGGVIGAIDALLVRADRIEGDGALARKLRADLLIEAANLATEHGMPERALIAAASAIESDPTRTDALPLVERNAHVEGGLGILDTTYDRLADAALGCFGCRAAHYRAARQLEKRGALDLALRHAAACFEAVPSEGTSFVLLSRLVERAGDPTEAVRAIERVADASDAWMRPTWLKRAAAIAGKDEDGARMRFDLLLRALNARADPSTVAAVADAARELGRLGGADESTEMVRLRVERAVKQSMRRLDGPDGARAGIAMSRLAIELGAHELAFAALDRAMEADGDVDEFESLEPLVAALVADAEGARGWIARVRATAEKPYSSVGKALLRMAAKVAHALSDTASRASLLVVAVRRFVEGSSGPEADALVTEADIAVAEHGDADLAAGLDAVAPPEQRAQAGLRYAEERERAGQDAEAIAALARVRDSRVADGETRARAAARMQRLLDRSGRDADAEALLRAELARASLPPAVYRRAAHDLADRLLRRDDRRGAFAVLAKLASEGPPDRDLLAEMRGLARATDDLGRYAEILAGAAKRADPAGRLDILRELGPLYTELGDAEQATACYTQIAELDPADAQALEILERAANERGDHEAIAALIGRRIALTPSGERKRMLRLRRAAVLEQRLGRLDETVRELDAILADAPDDVSALRFLADVHERRGAHLVAAGILVRLGEMSATSDEKAEYGLRAASAYLAAGEPDLAESTLESIAPIAPRDALFELRVDLSRARGDTRSLADSLEQLAASSTEPADRRAGFLLEAARSAASSGDDTTALDRAHRALKLAPALPGAVLEARRLEYKARGAGTPREAQAAVDDLARIESRLSPSQIELHAFLLAEELDVIQGGGAGMRELSRRHAEVGPLPLIALGMAERLVRGKNFEGALPLFERALAGDLQGMRTRGRVALAAAEAASHAHAFTVAAKLLDLAAAEPETQLIAQRRQLDLAATIGEPPIARQALEEILRQATGLDRARALLHLGLLLSDDEPETAARLFAEAVPLSSADRLLPAQIAEAIAHLEQRNAVPPEPPSQPVPEPEPAPPPREAPRAPEPVRASSRPPAPDWIPPLEPTRSSPPPAEPVRSPTPSNPPARSSTPSNPPGRPSTPSNPPARSSTPSNPPGRPSTPPEAGTRPSSPPGAPRVVAKIAQLPPLGAPQTASPSTPPPAAARPPSVPPLPAPPELPIEPAPPSVAHDETDEQRLLRELGKGSFEAGEQLVARYGARPGERTPDVLAVRRQQAAIRLGDRAALQKLVEAAVLDGNAAYARAVEHVLRVWDASGAPSPPPLGVQRLSPDSVAALLFRSIADSAVHEALALVLDTGLYRRDVGQYQLTGVARVQPTGGSVLGEVFGAIARLLGQARTALFHQRAQAGGVPLSFKIALLAPPAIVMSGEAREETPELRYLLGAALAGAMPEHALVNALGEEALRTLIDALHAAFGPVANLPRGNAAVARLGQNLWQLVPPRADRRLRELCADLSAITYDAAVAGTRRAMRHAGLFASGSLGTALAQIAPELGIPLADYQGSPDGLARAAAAHPEVADLVKLAIRTELAEARWLPGTAQERRRADMAPRSQRWDTKA